MMTDSFSLAWLVLLLPLAGFLVLAFAGSAIEKAFGRRVLGIVSVLPVAIAFVVAAIVTAKLAGLPEAQRSIVVPGIPWIDILGLSIPFELVVDPLSLTMSLIVTGVGSLIFLYSTGYMSEEREYSRFFTYMNLFAASMLLLVLGNNLPLLFIGWEGVGLCSYLLIGFWYTDLTNAKAANKAFIVNRIGDWGLTLGIFLIVVIVASRPHQHDARLLSYDHMLPALKQILFAHPALATTVGLLLFVGAAGKSAQFPLYLWLPDAMAGPTPVSALIHAATMVTSGVVLLNRMHVVFEASAVASAVVCGIGAFTALFAAIIAFGQTDIKRVLAYSTVSQLGFMFIGCGAGAYWAGMFHVTTHAFFKALLFLGAGAVIHAMAHDQDMRNYGRLAKYLPVTYVTMLIGWLSISAVFGFSGFYSKDALLGAALANDTASVGAFNISMYAGWLGLFTAMLTAAYMTRLIWLTFLGKEERWRHPTPHEESGDAHEHDGHGLTADHTPKEVPMSMLLPLVVLAALSLGGGWFLANNHLLENWLTPSSAATYLSVNAEPEAVPLTAISTGAALLGILAGIYVYRKGLPVTEAFDETKWSPTKLWIRRQFGFDDAMTLAAVDGGRELGSVLSDGVESGLIDRIVNGTGWLSVVIGKSLGSLQRGFVRSYALLMLLGGVCVVGYFLFGGSH
jgi:NADH-quinone oxidoreductase subunit L